MSVSAPGAASMRHRPTILPDGWSRGVMAGVLATFVFICLAQALMASGLWPWPPLATVTVRGFGGAIALAGAGLAWTRFAARPSAITLLLGTTLSAGAYFMLMRTVITLVAFDDQAMNAAFEASIRSGWAQNVALPLILLVGLVLMPPRSRTRTAAPRPGILIAVAALSCVLGSLGAWHPAFPGGIAQGALIARPDYAWTAALHLMLLMGLWQRSDVHADPEGRWVTFAIYVSFLNQVLVLPFWPPGSQAAASALGAFMNVVVYGIFGVGLLVGVYASKRAEDRARAEAAQLEEAHNRVEHALALQAARLQRANEELTQYAYVASHDLQEPLRMVTSYLQLVERRYDHVLDDEGREFMRFAVDGATRMRRLTNDLLSYAQVDGAPLDAAPIDLDDALASAMKNLEIAIVESGATITSEPLPTVVADRTQMVQLFQNLLSNAIKFRRPDAPPRVHVSAVLTSDEHVIEIADDGIGLDDRYRDKVFAVFQRLTRDDTVPGTGIGLALCRKIVRRHGGRIWFESREGSGTSFFVALPLAVEPTRAVPVVDDDPETERDVTTLIDRARELI